jgi:hypothetical protein
LEGGVNNKALGRTRFVEVLASSLLLGAIAALPTAALARPATSGDLRIDGFRPVPIIPRGTPSGGAMASTLAVAKAFHRMPSTVFRFNEAPPAAGAETTTLDGLVSRAEEIAVQFDAARKVRLVEAFKNALSSNTAPGGAGTFRLVPKVDGISSSTGNFTWTGTNPPGARLPRHSPVRI